MLITGSHTKFYQPPDDEWWRPKWTPSILIHSVGEADGDLTWFKSLSYEKQRLIVDDRKQIQEICTEDGEKLCTVPFEFSKAFQAADTDQDGLLNLEELKQFCQIIHASRINQGLPSKDPTDATDEQW